MANEFVARKGLIVLTNGAKITGSVNVHGDIDATGYDVSASYFVGDGSFLTNIASSLNFSGSSGGNDTLNLKTDALVFSGSNGLLANVSDNTVTLALPAGTVSASSQVSYTGLSNIPSGIVSASSQVSYTGLSDIPAGIVSSSGQVATLLPAGTVSASSQIDHDATTNFVANEHINHSTINISAGNGLSGGGYITSSLALTLDTGSTHFTNGVKTKLNADGVISSSTQITAVGFATTGSNTFTGAQTISDTTNSTTFADGALIVQGGVGIAKDVNISGSLNVTGLLTVVSMSTQYVTSSQYTIGTSRIILNDDDLVRFGGMTVMDSGSTPASGSILWDSLHNHFIIATDDIHDDTVTPHSSVLIGGPESYGEPGNEIDLVVGRVPIATTDHNIDNRPQSSSIRIIPTTLQTHIEAGLYITGSVTSSVGFSGDGSQLTGIASTLAEITTNGATTATQVTLNGGAIIHGILYTSGSNLDIDTGTEAVATIPTGSYDAAHFDYVVKKASNLRTGTVMVVWEGGTSNVEFTDTSTNDIGNTGEVVFSADTLTGNVRLLATVSTTDWAVKTAARLI